MSTSVCKWPHCLHCCTLTLLLHWYVSTVVHYCLTCLLQRVSYLTVFIVAHLLFFTLLCVHCRTLLLNMSTSGAGGKWPHCLHCCTPTLLLHCYVVHCHTLLLNMSTSDSKWPHCLHCCTLTLLYIVMCPLSYMSTSAGKWPHCLHCCTLTLLLHCYVSTVVHCCWTCMSTSGCKWPHCLHCCTLINSFPLLYTVAEHVYFNSGSMWPHCLHCCTLTLFYIVMCPLLYTVAELVYFRQ